MKRAYRTFATALALAALTGCGGALYKVKPALEAPMPATAAEARTGELVVRAAPLLTDEETQELFEANLLLAGVLPVRAEMMNTSATAVDLAKAAFTLRDATGAKWKLLSGKKAASQILKANGVTIYNPQSKKEFESAMIAHSLNVTAPLAANERRQGILFFVMSDGKPVESPKGLTLGLVRSGSLAELRLN